ncbi:MAG: TIGR04086 family membrane protein [Lachnospiraceae bacterium]|nr:TIGR04086 family membrane protein [Lachnospiraceae bacterium]
MTKERQKESAGGMMAWLLSLLAGYVLTGILLCALAFLLYRFSLSAEIVGAGIDLIYLLATFLAGFLAGRKGKNRRFLRGLVMGCAYFLLLAILSMATGLGNGTTGFWTALLLCAAGGMAGGMASGLIAGK